MVGELLTVFILLFDIVVLLVINAIWYPMPINDVRTMRYRSFPYVTIGLILANSFVFIFWQAINLYQGNQIAVAGIQTQDINTFRSGIDMLMDYFRQSWAYGVRAAYLRDGLSVGAFTTFTSMFMHGDMWHLFGNMFYLWAFGRRVEDSCGHGRFLIFYLTVGMAANIGSALLNPGSHNLATDVPGIGASGAIAGVMGAFLILHSGAWINCVWIVWSIIRVPIVSFMHLMGRMLDAPIRTLTPQVPAWLLLITFLALNLLPAFQTAQYGQTGGVDTVAHVIGFLAGISIFLFARKDLVTRFISGRAV